MLVPHIQYHATINLVRDLGWVWCRKAKQSKVLKTRVKAEASIPIK